MKLIKIKSIKEFWIPIIYILILAGCSSSQKLADEDTREWKYEIEAERTGVQGTYQIKVWSYSKDVETAIDQAKKNAVHGIIFKGIPGKKNPRIQGQPPLAKNPNLEKEKENFFKDFFKDGGKYMKYVTLVNNGAIEPGDRIKIGKKKYKIGVVIQVNKDELRKDLEKAGIIRALDSGF